MPVLIPIGIALGASAGTAALTGAVAVGTVASIGATGYSMYAQNKAAKSAAAVDNATADYNARYDQSMAAQLDLDTQQNIRTARAEDAVYLSREAASYASAGVLATSGSPLHAMIINAGRMEQKIQQDWVNSNQKQQQYAAAGKVGQLEGNALASADRMSGTLALINGGAKMAGQLFTGYESGVFSGSRKATAPVLDSTDPKLTQAGGFRQDLIA